MSEMYLCPCGKEFTNNKSTRKFSIDKFCSKKCMTRYSWYGRHAWLYGIQDLKARRDNYKKTYA